MALFKSSNPALSERLFQQMERVDSHAQPMSINGTIHKTAFLLFLTMAAAFYSWNLFLTPPPPSYMNSLVIGGSIIGFILALIIVFNKSMAGLLAPGYAVCKGIALGGISAYMEAQYPGIATQAIALTFSIFLGLLLIYRLRIIQVSENFKMIVGAATMGVLFFYAIGFILRLFGIPIMLLHSGSTGSIIFSLVVIAIASANLVVDFDFIEKGAAQQAPKYMEWYSAFGLMVTLVWLYIEILRLLAKMRSR